MRGVLECGTCDHECPPGALRTRIVVHAASPRMRGVDVEPLARMAMITVVVKGTGDGEAVGDRERRRRVLCMAVVLWSSGVWGRSCTDGSPGRRRRVEVGRGARQGNGGDAGNGERAVKVLGMRRSASVER
jgi:hypothetical protein